MPKPPKPFFDTNVLLYLLSGEAAKADRAEALLAGGGVVSVQVLNELVAVGRRKLGLSFAEAREVLAVVRALCRVESLTVDTHELAIDLAERLKLGIHDATIVAAALRAGCDVLYSEDMQHGQKIDGRMTIRNPFAE